MCPIGAGRCFNIVHGKICFKDFRFSIRFITLSRQPVSAKNKNKRAVLQSFHNTKWQSYAVICLSDWIWLTEYKILFFSILPFFFSFNLNAFIFYIVKIVIGSGDLDLPFLTLTSRYWSYCCCPSSTMLPSVSKIGFTSKIRSMSGNLYPNSVNNKLHISLSCVKMTCFA